MATEVELQDEEVRQFIKNLQTRTKRVKGADAKYIGLLSAIVYADVIRHFEEQQGSQGPWEKWSDSYTEYMKEQGKGGNKILQDTGKLRNNFKPQKVRSTNAGILWFNDAKTKKGFPYAAAHQDGGSRLPKRDFMWLSNDAIDKIAVQTLQFILEEGL